MTTPKPATKGSFFAELQRRNVYKVGAMYCVAGWLLVQIVTQVFPIFHVSELVQRIIVLAIVAGFPVALVLSWIYELTPQGIVKTDEVARDASITMRTGQKLNRAIIGVLLLAVLMMGAKLLWPRAEAPAAAEAKPTAAASDKSIAVLPFDNLSDDKANAYFAEGIQDEVLTRLAKVGSLRVISRTSTLQFAAHPGNLAEIAAKLGVANVVEGSVQKSGDAVRINVQLIRAEGDSHLWAETYDRKLDNVFSVQSEVAGAIAQALGAALSGGERQELAAVPTHDAAAYDAYLRGVALYGKGFSDIYFRAATHAFEQAVAADPGFAQAWAKLARGNALMVFFGDDASPERRAAALHAVEQAERLAPDTLETRGARAYYTYRVVGDFDEALRQFQALHERWPNDVEVLTVMSYIHARQDHLDLSMQYQQAALQLDPLNIQLHKLAAFDLEYVRRFDEALAELVRVQAIAPEDPEWRSMKAGILLQQGKLTEAADLLEPPPLLASQDGGAYAALMILQRNWKTGIAWLEGVLARPDPDALASDWISLRVTLGELRRLSGDARGADVDFKAAVELAQAELQRSPDNGPIHPQLALALAGLGDERAALHEIDLAQQQAPESKDALIGRLLLDVRARLLLRFGHKDEALLILRHLLASPGQSFYFNGPLTPELLRLDPDWDSLRQDPRFQALLGPG